MEHRAATTAGPAPAAGGAEWIKDHIRDVPDFPTPGVVYKDITPLLGDAAAFARTIDELADAVAAPVDKVVGIEARGFILAAPVALRLGAGFVPVRKAGKLPWAVTRRDYALEYRAADTLEVHTDALAAGERVLIIDDVLATGGTAVATAALVEALGAEVVALGCVIELSALGGRQTLGSIPATSLVSY